MTPTEAALRAALEEAEEHLQSCCPTDGWGCRDRGADADREETLRKVRAALAAPPHGKDAGEEPRYACAECGGPGSDEAGDLCLRCAELVDLRRRFENLQASHEHPRLQDVARIEALQALIHTAANALDIVAASPQDFITHVLLLREERDELKARLTEAEGLLREYLCPGRNSPEDLDRDTAAFLMKPPEATP